MMTCNQFQRVSLQDHLHELQKKICRRIADISMRWFLQSTCRKRRVFKKFNCSFSFSFRFCKLKPFLCNLNCNSGINGPLQKMQKKVLGLFLGVGMASTQLSVEQTYNFNFFRLVRGTFSYHRRLFWLSFCNGEYFSKKHRSVKQY